MATKPKPAPKKSAGKKLYLITPRVEAAYGKFLYEPDDKAPAGADWKPDGKYKLRGLVDSIDDFSDMAEKITAAAQAKFGDDVDLADFIWPWKEHAEDDKYEAVQGKTSIMAKSKYAPGVFDSKNTAVPKKVKVFGGDIVKMRVEVYLFEKTEEQVVVTNGKKTKQTVTVRGASLRLLSVQLLVKNAGGADGGFGEEEDGFVSEPDEDGAEQDQTDAATGGEDGDF